MFHMIQLLKCFNTQRRITLPETFFDDILWWQTFAESFNGYADFFDPVENTIELYTDACLTGLAAICQNDYYVARVVSYFSDEICYSPMTPNAYTVMIPNQHAKNINVLVLVAILLALIRWNALLVIVEFFVTVITYKSVITYVKTKRRMLFLTVVCAKFFGCV